MEFAIIFYFARSNSCYKWRNFKPRISMAQMYLLDWEGIVYGNENIIFFCSLVPFLFSAWLSCVLCALYPEYIHAAAMLFHYY